MEQSFMKERAVFPLVLAMSVPNILSMLVNSLYNIVDSFFVARIGEKAMMALSLVYPVQNISLSIGVGFSIGINAVIAMLLGMGEGERANRAGTLGLLFCALHGLLLTAVCIPAMPHFLRLFSSDGEVLRMGMEYSIVVFLFCAPHHLYIGMEKIYQSVGRMKTSMIAMMTGCVLNILLDPVLIFGLGPFPAMGIKGAALATGLGQVCSFLFYIVMYFKSPIPVKFGKKHLRADFSMLGRLYAVGAPASISMALPSLLISALNSILSVFSEVYIVVLGIYYKLQTFVYMPANGIIQGIRPLVGYNYGAGEEKRVRRIYQTALFLGALMMLFGTLLCLFLPERLMSFFSENKETVKAGVTALTVISMGFLPSAVSVTTCGFLEGLGRGLQSLVISLLRFTVFIIPPAFLFSRRYGAEGVWHAFWTAELLTAFVSVFLYRNVFTKCANGFPKKTNENRLQIGKEDF